MLAFARPVASINLLKHLRPKVCRAAVADIGEVDTMHRRIERAVVGIVALAIFISGCGQRATPPPTQITIGTFSKAYGNLPYYVAKHFNWFESDPALKGVALHYTEYNDRPSISDAFGAGKLQALFSGDAPALLCRAQGNDIRAVVVSGYAEQEVVVRPDSVIKDVSDLKAKRVVVQQATSSHYALLRILKMSGLGESDISLQFMAPAEGRAAFESGQVDAWAVWAPFVEQEQVAGVGRVVVGSNARINSLMSLSEDLIKSQRPIAVALANSIRRAKQWMVANPADAQKIAVEQLALDPKVVVTAWPKFNWQADLDDAMSADLQAKVDFLAAQDKTRQSKSVDVKRDYVDITVR